VTNDSLLVAWQEPGKTTLHRAAEWHEWAPRWLPGRVASAVKRAALTRYRASILCRLPSGQQFFADPSDLVQCFVGTTGGWEQLIFEAVRPFVSEGSTVLDIGAHVGYAALRLGDWVGASGRVVCFEPVPGHVAQLSRNLKVNSYDARTTVVPLAVSDGAGERPFFDGQGANSGMGSLASDADRSPSRLVHTVSLDSWLMEHAVGEIALTKIDVEGAEALVLRGMVKTLTAACHRAVLVELHPNVEPNVGQQVAEIFHRLEPQPYALFDWTESRFEPIDGAPQGYCLLAVRRDSLSAVSRRSG
jgi:FkbM family methyltransferase